MLLRDYSRLILRSLSFGVTRSGLTITGIAMGIAAVVLLTSLGDGLTRYVVNTFTQFGTNLLQIQPGKATTLGATVGRSTRSGRCRSKTPGRCSACPT